MYYYRMAYCMMALLPYYDNPFSIELVCVCYVCCIVEGVMCVYGGGLRGGGG